MPQLVPFFMQKFKVSYYIIPSGRNPLPVWRSREVTLTRATNELFFTHEELAVLAMKCGDEETEFANGEVVDGISLERINIVGIIPLAD